MSTYFERTEVLSYLRLEERSSSTSGIMQALNAGCLGHPFALTRCYASGEKRHRRRKTKEERKSMVELFLTEYRSKHNGNFPSLNMTHKEVGGSFYTIREIVRDIIQENKVLAPGNASLKSLSLEDCSENHENVNTNILNKSLESQFSISSIACPLDEQIEFSSESESEVAIPSIAEPIYNGQISFSSELDSDSLISSNKHQLQNKQTESFLQLEKPDEVERVESLISNQESSHPHFSFSKYVHPKTYGYLQQSSDSADQSFLAELKEDISSAKSGQAQNIGTCKQITTELHDGPEICSMERVEQKSLFSQSIPSSSPLNSTVLDDEETRSHNHTFSNTTDDITEVHANYLTYKADMLPEKSLSNDASNRLFDGSVAFDEEDSSLEFFSVKTFISDLHDLNTDELNESDKSSGTKSLAAEVKLPIRSTDKTSNMYEVEEGAIRLPILVDNEPDNPDSPLHESSDIHSSAVSEVEATETGDSPGELFLTSLKERATVEPKAECMLSVNNYDGASRIRRKLPQNSNKEMEKGENNVLWRAIKSFVASIFKFWTQ